MTEDSKIKAVLIGFASYILLLILSAVLLLLLALAISLFLPSSLDYLNSAFLWIGLILNSAILLAAGYLASSATKSRKLLTGFFLGCLAAVIILFLDYVVIDMRCFSLWYSIIFWPSLLLFPTAGAYIETGRTSDRLWKKILRTTTAYTALTTGLFLLSSCILLLAFSPEEMLDNVQKEIILWITVVGAGFIVYAAYTFVKTAGLKRGLAKNYLSCFIYVLILLHVGNFIYRYHTNLSNREHLKKITEEINKHYFVPEDENGAHLYMAAVKSIPPDFPSKKLFITGRPLWKESEHPLSARWIKKCEQGITLAVEAGQMKSIFFPLSVREKKLDWNEPLDLRFLSRVLCAKARSTAIAGDVSQSLIYLDSAFVLGTSLSRGTFFSLIIGRACRDIAVRSLADIVEQIDLSREELLLLKDMLEAWASHTFPKKEAWAVYAKLETVSISEQFFEEICKDYTSYYLAGFFVSKKSMRKIINSSWKPLLEAETLSEIRDRCDRFYGSHFPHSKYNSVFPSTRKMGLILQSILMPCYVKTIDMIFEQQTRIDILRVYTAASLYKAAEGSLPEGWQDIVPEYLQEIPLDPFSDKPLKLKTNAEAGLVIYSVGKDRKDNGGNDPFYKTRRIWPDFTSDKKEEEEDIALTVKLNKN